MFSAHSIGALHGVVFEESRRVVSVVDGVASEQDLSIIGKEFGMPHKESEIWEYGLGPFYMAAVLACLRKQVHKCITPDTALRL